MAKQLVFQQIFDTGADAPEYTEKDPTVPSWAKESTKPSYTKSEVGLGNVDNVKQYSESNPPPYPVTKVNNKTGAVTLSASDVGADASGTASSAVSSHNTNTSAHNDIRLLLQDLIDRVNAVLDSDDQTLDELSEIVAYIKNNKTLIDNVTTSKVNVSDIVNNLTSNVTNKPLSASQGVALKALIDAITVPTKVSQLTNDKNYLTSVPAEYVTETELNAKGYLTQHQSLSGYAKTADHYTKTETDNKYQPKGNYLTSHQDISGKADKSSAETWTFTLKDGSTVTKKVVLA